MRFQNNYNEYGNDMGATFFGNLNEDGYCYDTNQPNELFIKFNAPVPVHNFNEEIPKQLYMNFNEENEPSYNEDFSSSFEEPAAEITSVVCENEFQEKQQVVKDNSHCSHSTYEADSASGKASQKSYEDLFLMIEDKNMYEIGSDEDTLSPQNNEELLKLDKIVSNKQTDLNMFIGDMLKHCPCDNLIKKQRIYKAKNIKRKRKTKTQLKQLQKELAKVPVWDKDDFKRLSETLCLSRDQVYKWYWDQKNKSQ